MTGKIKWKDGMKEEISEQTKTDWKTESKQDQAAED